MEVGDFAAIIVGQSVERFQRFRQRLKPPLQNLLDEVLGRWSKAIDAENPFEPFFCGAGGTPAFQLIAWLAESVLADSQRAAKAAIAGEAMLCLYFTARCQDDRVDEGADAKLTFLETALSARAVRLLVEVAADADVMLAEWESLASEFGAAAFTDATARSAAQADWGEATIAVQGKKYFPMCAPLAALLIAAGRSSELPALRATIEKLGLGLQLSNDIFGAERDLNTKQGSPFLADLNLQPGRDTATGLLPAMRRALRKGHLQRVFDQAATALRSGLEPLANLPSQRLATHIEARIGELEAIHRRLSLLAIFGVPEIVADLEITRRCNLRCPACFVFAQEEAGHKLPELSTPLLLAILEELSGYRTHLHITGGEAFLHHGIWDVLAEAAKLGMTEVIINTNGSYLDEARLRRLAALPLSIRLLVSIDGPPGVQESARGKGMTDKALNAIRIGHRLGISAEPATIMTAELVDYGVDKWFEYLSNELSRKPSLVLWPIFLQPDMQLTPEEGGSMLDSAHLWAAARQIAGLMLSPAEVVVADYPVINPLLARLGVPVERLWQCNAGRGRLSVQADGMLSPCHPFRLSLGKITPDSVHGFVDRVLTHADYQRLGKRDHEGCASCPEQGVCGNCQAVVVGKGGKLFSNDHFCDTVIGPLEERSSTYRPSPEGNRRVLHLPVVA